MQSEFPFHIQQVNDESYEIVADLEDSQLFPKYYDLFGRYGYEGNGPCWEGHIEQMLEVLDPDLLNNIEFDSEASSFRAILSSEQDKNKFIQLLTPIFSNTIILEHWIEKANRDHIDD